ncbi:hypothetical protein ACCS66_01145 [Rhizobium ruizarguesonis]
MRFVLIAVGFILSLSATASGQSFSCPIGRQPSCLGYSDKVVDKDSSCFTSYTCDFNGFMCVSDHEDYVKKAKRMASGYDDFKNCVARAMDMDGVQSCIRSDNLRLP